MHRNHAVKHYTRGIESLLSFTSGHYTCIRSSVTHCRQPQKRTPNTAPTHIIFVSTHPPSSSGLERSARCSSQRNARPRHPAYPHPLPSPRLCQTAAGTSWSRVSSPLRRSLARRWRTEGRSSSRRWTLLVARVPRVRPEIRFFQPCIWGKLGPHI